MPSNRPAWCSPLALEPALDDTKQLLFVVHPVSGIDAFATTRDGLLRELAQQVAMLWREYAQAPNDALDTEAQHLMDALLEALEVRDAA